MSEFTDEGELIMTHFIFNVGLSDRTHCNLNDTLIQLPGRSTLLQPRRDKQSICLFVLKP